MFNLLFIGLATITINFVNPQTTIKDIDITETVELVEQVCTDLELGDVDVYLFENTDNFTVGEQIIYGCIYKGFWVIGTNDIYLNVTKNDTNTIVHELRHMWQYENGLFVDYIYSNNGKNVRAYRGQPLEQDARAFDSAYFNNELCDYINLMPEN